MRAVGQQNRRAGERVQGSATKDEGGRRKDELTRVADTAVPIHPSSFILHPSDHRLALLPPLTRGGRGGWSRRVAPASATALVLLIGLSVVVARAQEVPSTRPTSQSASRPVPTPTIRFTYLDVYIDSKDQPLAAYQFELAAERGDVKIVGIEGGEHAAFKAPPYYDPAAMSQDHVILAAFNTGKDLPTGKTRVARVHVQVAGEAKPEYVIKLEVAASSEGQPISGATAMVSEGGSR
jgi:hypothetical protein